MWTPIIDVHTRTQTFIIMHNLLHRLRKLTEDFDGDEVRLSLANLIDSDAGDVGLSLQGHRADGPVVGVDIVDPVTAPSPDVTVGSWTTYKG